MQGGRALAAILALGERFCLVLMGENLGKNRNFCIRENYH